MATVEVPAIAFYLVTVALVLVLVLACVLLYYAIRLVRSAERLTNSISHEYRHWRGRLRQFLGVWSIWRVVRMFTK